MNLNFAPFKMVMAKVGEDFKGGIIWNQSILWIRMDKTGENIQDLMKRKGYTVKDIQQVMGFENPQAVYKWLSGQSLPTLDNILILSKTLDVSIDDILVYEGDGLD